MASKHIHDLALQFTQELAQLHAALAWSDYTESTLTLTVEYKNRTPHVSIRFSKGYGDVSVKGASLGAVMDEVRRRFDYNDKAEGDIGQASQSLLALTDESETAEDDTAKDDIQF